MTKGATVPEPSMDDILSSIRKIIAEDEVAAPAAPTPPRAPQDEDDDILELTEADETDADGELEPVLADAGEVADDGLAALMADTDEIDSDVEETGMERDPLELDQDQAEPGPATVGAGEVGTNGADTAAGLTAGVSEVLLDTSAASVASGALQRLSAAMTPGAAVPGGARTIEAFLADLVRPELKSWLDQHLPALVERIVEREIKKLVRDAQPE